MAAGLIRILWPPINHWYRVSNFLHRCELSDMKQTLRNQKRCRAEHSHVDGERDALNAHRTSSSNMMNELTSLVLFVVNSFFKTKCKVVVCHYCSSLDTNCFSFVLPVIRWSNRLLHHIAETQTLLPFHMLTILPLLLPRLAAQKGIRGELALISLLPQFDQKSQ